MAPKNNNSSSSEDATVGFTTSDAKIIDTVLKSCLPTAKPNPSNWEEVAKQADLKDGKSARERFRQICKKHQWFETSAKDPATPSPSPKKRAASQMITTPTSEQMANPGSGEEGDAKGTPTKKRKAAPAKKRQTPNTKKAAKVKTETESFETDDFKDDGAAFTTIFDHDEA
ncbi:hypothetical protein F5Y13DRAFT_204974 [Hypoxylon sp. FL1857]|nr:hypothetical protein F5Y13DRAFT_204974 [Hypoxylon sp. FL1857]